MADAWLAASKDLDPLPGLHAVEVAYQAAAVAPSQSRPWTQRKVQPKRLFARARPRHTAARKAGDASGLVEELALLLEEAGAFRPKHAKESQLQEWKGYLRQVAEQKVEAAEEATVKNVIRSLAELSRFQLLRGRAEGLRDVDVVDLASFLTAGTSAPSRALPALRWFSKHGALAWEVQSLRPPPRSTSATSRQQDDKQAAPAEPWMAIDLERKVKSAYESGHATWMPLLGSWLVCFACPSRAFYPDLCHSQHSPLLL